MKSCWDVTFRKRMFSQYAAGLQLQEEISVLKIIAYIPDNRL